MFIVEMENVIRTIKNCSVINFFFGDGLSFDWIYFHRTHLYFRQSLYSPPNDINLLAVFFSTNIVNVNIFFTLHFECFSGFQFFLTILWRISHTRAAALCRLMVYAFHKLVEMFLLTMEKKNGSFMVAVRRVSDVFRLPVSFHDLIFLHG